MKNTKYIDKIIRVLIQIFSEEYKNTIIAKEDVIEIEKIKNMSNDERIARFARLKARIEFRSKVFMVFWSVMIVSIFKISFSGLTATSEKLLKLLYKESLQRNFLAALFVLMLTIVLTFLVIVIIFTYAHTKTNMELRRKILLLESYIEDR